MQMKLSEIAKIVGGELRGEDVILNGLCVDSRRVNRGDLFVAVVGKQADGHEFIEHALRNGAVGAMVTKDVHNGYSTIRVNSIEDSFAKIATHIRESFTGPVIGVTGSVGKTTVKEFLAGMLGGDDVVLKTPSNMNTEYGVPIAWMMLEKNHKYAVIEMAMRGEGQIAHLCSFSKPTHGIITAIGSAHIGELGSKEAIIRAKSELTENIPDDGVIVLPFTMDLPMLMSYATCKVITFGEDESCDVKVLGHEMLFHRNMTRGEWRVNGNNLSAEVPGIGSQQVLNVAGCLGVCLGLGFDVQTALNNLSNVKLPPDRLRRAVFQRGTILIDVYNSSPESCIQALEVLNEFPAQGKKIAILGDMLELGDFEEEEHTKIGKFIAGTNVDMLIGVGERSHWIVEGAKKSGFSGETSLCKTAEEAAKWLLSLREGDVLLIKGSRALQLENALIRAGVEIDSAHY